jgi:poly-gamma-glutamate synthesis protein (capsule biosynthesis protein)
VTPLSELSMTDQARDILAADISAVRDRAALVIVAMHKGIVHTPAVLAGYERELARAAVDAGADIVVGHHAHILRGIEFHRGKPIFHGLGNGCVVTHALAPDQAHPDRAAWAKRRKELFGFEPDPAYTLAPFHPQAVNAMLGHVTWMPGHGLQAGIIPVHVEAPGRPVAASGARAAEVVEYVAAITTQAGMPAVHFERGEAAWTVH